ncbi:MAG: hypothetical protein KKG60_00705 [Nanoarchaeota archaeon]|nr:hypothetical protein [Nanoarchaeota archaeon]
MERGEWSLILLLAGCLFFISGCIEPVDYESAPRFNVDGGVNEFVNETMQGVNETVVGLNENVLNESADVNAILDTNQTPDAGLNETLNETIPEKESIVYGAAVSKSNNTYVFKINDQVVLSNKIIRVEKIWADSVLVFVNNTSANDTYEDREKIPFLGGTRMAGFNITLTEIFYDNFISGRLAYLRIV